MTHKITIIGGGYAGIMLGKALEEDAYISIIEPRSQWVHNVASIRALTDTALLEKTIMPYDNLLKNGEVIQGRAKSIEGTTVTLENGEIVSSDSVIIATGSNYASPFKVQNDDVSDYKATLKGLAEKISNASRIAIVGSGPVGIELAGETAVAYPDIDIDLITADKSLFPTLPAKLGRKLEKQLNELGVKIHFNTMVENLKHADQAYTGQLSLPDGTKIEADLIFPAIGARTIPDFIQTLEGAELDNLGRVKVDSWLRPAGMSNVHIVGDAVSAGDPMTIVGLTRQVNWLSKALKAQSGGKSMESLKPYKPWKKAPILVPLGKEKGASLLPGMVVGPRLTSKIKGKDLFISRYRKDFGLNR